MNVIGNHAGYPVSVIRRATLWAAKQIGLDPKVLKRYSIEVGYHRNRRGGGSWGGWHHSGCRLVQVMLPRVPVTYPQCMAINRAEREAGRDAHDEWELFVAILAHELEHARAHAVARTWEDRARLNYEPRVRAVDWRTMLAFREARETLVAEWTRVAAERPARPAKTQPTPVERRAARAEELLAAWERKLRLAKTKVQKYRRKVGYYQKAAARRQGGAR